MCRAYDKFLNPAGGAVINPGVKMSFWVGNSTVDYGRQDLSTAY